MSEQPYQPSKTPDTAGQPVTIGSVDDNLRRFREYVAAGIAGMVILGAVILVIMGMFYTDDANRFSRVKDLINIMTPLLTFVLGYYFNKTSTEARAEKAEMTAQSAVTTAQKATQDRAKAEQFAAETLEEKNKESKKADELQGMVEEFDSQLDWILEDFSAPTAAAAPGTLSFEEGGEAQAERIKEMEERRRKLQRLRDKAQFVLQK